MKVTIEDLHKVEEFVKLCEEKKGKVESYSVDLSKDEGYDDLNGGHLMLIYYTHPSQCTFKKFFFELGKDDYEAFINELKEL